MESLNSFESEMEADGQGHYSLFPALDSIANLSGSGETLESEPPSEIAEKPNLTWLDAAQIVLEEAGRPMHIKEIKQRIIDRGLVQSNAKSSLEAVMYRETQKGSRRFKRIENRNGVFALLTDEERQQALQAFAAQSFLGSPHQNTISSSGSGASGPAFPSPTSSSGHKTKMKRGPRKTQNEKYRLKYLRLRKAARAMIFENAALCDEVAHLEEKFLRAKEERRFLLKSLLQYQTFSEGEILPTPSTSSHPVVPSAVTCEQVAEFLQDLISAVVQILVHRGRLQGWQPERMGDRSLGVKLLAEQMCSELKPSDQGVCDVSCLEDWIFRVSQVSLYMEMLVSEGLNVSLSGRPTPTLLPPCIETPWKNMRCMLDLPTLMFLAPQLPDSCSAPWRLVFSTQLHGESFTRMVAGLMKRGPTLLLLKDTKGHVFGCFASHAWEVKPQFQGDSRCFLFTVFPTLRVYTATGYNQHFMYLNQHQQTMPNGLGMGGQHGYFGLWLDSDFGKGHSRARPKCTTYGSPQLSGEEDFTLDLMEVWAVGKPPEPEEGEEGQAKKSVLNMDPEVQAIMEMTGKTLHSQGLREPEEDQ